MAYTKDITNADAYFKPNAHLKGHTWSEFSQNDRKAALAQAQQELELYTGRQMVDPESDWTYGARDDYAVFEQAIFMLENIHRRNAAGTVRAVKLPKKDAGREPRQDDIGIAPMAQRWLGMLRIRAVRG